LPLVWPYASGTVRGMGLEPLHAAVPKAAHNDPELGERLALVDALRLGDARLADVGRRELDALLSTRMEYAAFEQRLRPISEGS